MSNTVIQIKRSLTSSEPPSLNIAELAYSYVSNTVFIGTPDGTGKIAIGGQRYLEIQNSIFTLANAAFDKANSDIDSANAANAYAQSVGAAGNAYVNVSTTAANNYAGYMANAANALSTNIALSANNYAGYMANAANAFASSVGILANDYANLVGTSANSYAGQVGQSANVYADGVGVSANAYTDSVGDSANNYAGFMVNAANSYADATYFPYTGGTINGDVSIHGEFHVVGNAFFNDTTTVNIGDPLLYIASNNYNSDVVDIGIVGNYNNGTANLHTGVYRDAGNKEWYVFQGYDVEPEDNIIDPTSHNFTLAVLNADLRTSNLNLGGANAIVWISAAFDKANAANVLAYDTGIGANAYASAVGTAANAYADQVGTSANTYASGVGTSANTYADGVGTSANVYASAVGTSANAYADGVGTAANTNAANGSYISSGIVKVPYGGTGKTSFTSNGILFGNTTGDLKVTSAGTEGQVLQADASGVPQFGMLDGGSF